MAKDKRVTAAKLRRVLRECARLLAECDQLLGELSRAVPPAPRRPRRSVPDRDGKKTVR